MAASHLLMCLPLLMIATAIAKPFYGFGKEIDMYIKESSQRYQVNEKMLRGLVKIEDGWYGKRSPTGALGVGQFTVGTWNWLASMPEGKAIGMSVITSKNRGTHKDPRHNKYINTLATGLLARWHTEQFNQRGIKVTDANLYMAHNIGLDGYHRALLGKSTKDDIRNMKLNGMTRKMSVRDFIIYQKSRYYQHALIANNIPINNLPITQNTKSRISKSKNDLPSIRWIEPTTANKIIWINPL
ncbi:MULTISPECIES: hypothetical protein [Glaesserella]|uniref:Lytic murein transglycosylase n=1 Tax=Glaesserella australis TaxID=2094024 RepID=A0A328C0H6_9PAST|nr:MULTISPECIES: hypothetical protein [Glaesserella]AUI65880.1 hypothetical protein CJD39_04510 [Glaesserella sp. 15-184]RAL17974.1 hypothetical protein C5N92_10070 [Glaesserella australis]